MAHPPATGTIGGIVDDMSKSERVQEIQKTTRTMTENLIVKPRQPARLQKPFAFRARNRKKQTAEGTSAVCIAVFDGDGA